MRQLVIGGVYGLGLGLSGCVGASIDLQGQGDEQAAVAGALTREVDFEDGEVVDGPLPETQRADIVLQPVAAAILMAPSRASIMAVEVENPDEDDDPITSTLIAVDKGKRHFEVQAKNKQIASQVRGEAPAMNAEVDPSSRLRIENRFSVGSGVCDDLCNKVFAIRVTEAPKLASGAVGASSQRTLVLDCREAGDEDRCFAGRDNDVDDETIAEAMLGDQSIIGDGDGDGAGDGDGDGDSVVDAGTDAGPNDAGVDASTPDAGGQPDASTPDAGGQPDASTPDAGPMALCPNHPSVTEDTGTMRCHISGRIASNLRLFAGPTYHIEGGVFVGSDGQPAVLTIDPGVTILAEPGATYLSVSRGSRLIADGLPSAPIVFTSAAAPGTRAPGDWGGIVLNGHAPINAFAELMGEGGTGTFGGSDRQDGSGVLRYVRIEFGGFEITPAFELSGLSLNGVGSGTTVDFVHVHATADDGVEMLGGTVNLRHILVTGFGDDGFDWAHGWTGRAQFVAIQQWPAFGQHGIEADNYEGNPTATPMSNPLLSHFTIVGAPNGPSSEFGMMLRRGTGGRFHNTIIMDFPAACLAIRDLATVDAYAQGQLAFFHSITSCSLPYSEPVDDVLGGPLNPDFPTPVRNAFTPNNGNVVTDPSLTAPSSITAPNFLPMATSPALTGGVPPQDPFFDTAAGFRGAFGTVNWASGWAQFPQN